MKTLNKYFVFSDVHGEYGALLQGLEKAGYDKNDPTHKLVSLGDAFDRGPDSRKIYEYLTNRNAIMVKGNHDVMFQEYLEKGMDGEFVLFNILHNGLGATIQSFGRMPNDVFSVKAYDEARRNFNYSSVLRTIQNMPIFYETSSFVFVHAGIDPRRQNWKETDDNFALWDIDYSHEAVPNANKIVVIGHHHASKVRENGKAAGYGDYDLKTASYTINHFDEHGNKPTARFRYYGNEDENRPYVNNNKIAIDGMTNLTGKVNILVVEDYPLDDPNVKSESEPQPEPQLDDSISVAAWPDIQSIGINMADFARATQDMAWTYTTTTAGYTDYIPVGERPTI